MKIPIQIDTVSIARATNAAHYEYLATVMRRVEEIPIENDLWRKAVDEFRRASTDEDKAFKKYSASLKTALHDESAGRFAFHFVSLPQQRPEIQLRPVDERGDGGYEGLTFVGQRVFDAWRHFGIYSTLH